MRRLVRIAHFLRNREYARFDDTLAFHVWFGISGPNGLRIWLCPRSGLRCGRCFCWRIRRIRRRFTGRRDHSTNGRRGHYAHRNRRAVRGIFGSVGVVKRRDWCIAANRCTCGRLLVHLGCGRRFRSDRIRLCVRPPRSRSCFGRPRRR
jgi:hypothetical protein